MVTQAILLRSITDYNQLRLFFHAYRYPFTMRIGIDGRVISDHFPGIGRVAWNMARSLARRFPTDQVVILFHREGASRLSHGELAGPNVSFAFVNGGTFSPLGQLRAGAALNGLGLDVLYAPYILFPLRVKAPVVVAMHDLIPLRFSAEFSLRTRLTYRLFVERAARAARHIVTGSEWVAGEIATLGIAPRKRVTVVPYAADPLPTADKVHESYVMAVGADRKLKNFPTLVEGFAAAGLDVPLLIAGSSHGGYRETERAIQRFNLGSRVVRPGSVSEETLANLYAGALAVAVPSRAEGFGLPALEGMVAGKPVIASTAPALPEVTAGAAFDVVPNSVDAWAAALRTVATDADLRLSLKERGCRRAAEFSWDNSAALLHSVLEQVVR